MQENMLVLYLLCAPTEILGILFYCVFYHINPKTLIKKDSGTVMVH